VPQYIVDAAYLPPRNVGLGVGQVVGNRATRFGNDLDRPLHQPAQLPACLKIDQRLAVRDLLDALDASRIS
jgi:hypothetical protein